MECEGSSLRQRATETATLSRPEGTSSSSAGDPVSVHCSRSSSRDRAAGKPTRRQRSRYAPRCPKCPMSCHSALAAIRKDSGKSGRSAGAGERPQPLVQRTLDRSGPVSISPTSSGSISPVRASQLSTRTRTRSRIAAMASALGAVAGRTRTAGDAGRIFDRLEPPVDDAAMVMNMAVERSAEAVDVAHRTGMRGPRRHRCRGLLC